MSYCSTGLKLKVCEISSRDLLYNIVPRVENTVLYSENFKKVDLKCSYHRKRGGRRILLEVMDLFITFIVMMVLWVYAYVESYPIV